MEICRDSDGKVYDWVIARLKKTEGDLLLPNHLTLAVREGNIIYAGIVYSKIYDIVWLTIYAENPRWALRGIISKLFLIACGMGKIAKMATSHKNARINKFLWGLGMRKEGFLRFQRPNGRHEIVWSITMKELRKKRWYKNERCT